MDPSQFDRLTRVLGTRASRRAAFALLLGTVLQPLLTPFGEAHHKHRDRDKNRHPRRTDQERDKGERRQAGGTGARHGRDQEAKERAKRRATDLPRSALSCCSDENCAPGPKKSLKRCCYEGRNLTGANFNQSNLTNASFAGATLRNANFNGANLSKVCFVDANLTGANVNGANTADAIYCRTTMPNGSTNNSGCANGTSCCPTCDARHPCGSGKVCCDGRCWSGNCCTNTECGPAGNRCANHVCKCGTGTTCAAPTPLCCGTGTDGRCQACCTNSQCPAERPFCHNGQCAGCRDEQDCTQPDEPCREAVCATDGTCQTRDKANGTGCNDGDACTRTDTCQSGRCVGSNPVTCPDPDQCHERGECDPQTGECAYPHKPDGAACNDGNACTRDDACQNGVCIGGAPVVCPNPDQCHRRGECDPVSGACSDPAKPDGSTCDDGNPCTIDDTCQNGTCRSGDPVICPDPGQCYEEGTCDPADGACAYAAKGAGTPCNYDGTVPPCQTAVCGGGADAGNCILVDKANGTACDDGDACTQTDTCQNGRCVGGHPVVCPEPDQCHEQGTCDPATGQCSNPRKVNGTICNDGNACTRHDTCQAGECVGGDPVACTPSDQCHDAGVCNPQTGECSNPAKPDGTTCNDGDACTRTDSCQAGQCVGADPVICPDPDQCHEQGECDPSTGACSNPAKPDDTACDDGDACTVDDTCQSGECRRGAAVICPAPDQCHEQGMCDPGSGDCSYEAKPEGTACVYDGSVPQCQTAVCGGGADAGTCILIDKTNGTECDDGSLCTRSDTCQNGACIGGDPVVCTALDQCHVAGACDPATGVCSNPNANDGTTCDDGDACTQTDTCRGGVCIGDDPMVCPDPDLCHDPGVCDPTTGACSNPAKADGTACNDGDACTQTDTCQAGVCTGSDRVACAPLDACHLAGVCDPDTGVCSDPVAPDGPNEGCPGAGCCAGVCCTGVQDACVNNQCVCQPKTCADFPGECGAIPDGCGQISLQCACADGCCDLPVGASRGACAAGGEDAACGSIGEICLACDSASGFHCAGGDCVCDTGFHDCAGVCASNSDPATCGTSCTPCPAPPANATATCTNGTCGFACITDYHECNGACISDTDNCYGPGGCLSPDPNHPDGTDGLKTAIAYAAADATITLCPGTWTVRNTPPSPPVPIIENLTLVGAGASGANASVLQIKGGGYLLRIGSAETSPQPTVALRDLKVTRATTSTNGGGIQNFGTLTMERCAITNSVIQGVAPNLASGAGLSNRPGARATLTDCEVAGNRVDGAGGGIFTDGVLDLVRTAVTGNTATARNGGGIGVGTNGAATLTDSSVSGNTAGGAGGGIVNGDRATLILRGTSVTGNTATSGNGGGILSFGPATLGPSASGPTRVRGNQASASGAGIFSNVGGAVTLEPGTVVCGNSGAGDQQCDAGFGGTLSGACPNPADCAGCDQGTVVCGDICVDPASFQTDPENCGACGNTCAVGQSCVGGTCCIAPVAGDPTAGLQAAVNAAAAGDTLQLCPGTWSMTSPVTIGKNLQMSGKGADQTVLDGGDVSSLLTIAAGTTVTVARIGFTRGRGNPGGAIANYGNLTLNRCALSDNGGGDGGAIHHQTGTLTLTNCALSNNYSKSDGGAVRTIGGSLAMTDCAVENNRSDNNGGGVLVWQGTATLSGVTFRSNTTNGDGGGFYVGASTALTVTLAGCTLEGNTAGSQGGGLFTWNHAITMDGACTVTANVAQNGGGVEAFGAGSVTLQSGLTLRDNTPRNCAGNVIDPDRVCCPGSYVQCGSLCTDPQRDPANCSGCGHSCGSGPWTCEGGACVCPSPYTPCGGACVDLNSNPSNCGGCGQSCGGVLACQGGTCVCPYPMCDGICVDFATDPNNCGGCAQSCGAGDWSCDVGTCACYSSDCDGNCTDTDSDPNNCGGCGIACPDGICSGGECR